MQIIDNKLYLLRTRNPEKYSIIPKHKIVSHDNGIYEVAVHLVWMKRECCAIWV